MKKNLCIALLALSACSVSKAANQPESKDLSVLHLYNTRMNIIGEFGAPTGTETNPQGFKVDTFSFVNGYSAASRSARAVGHGLADVASLGLWELAGNSIETSFNGSQVSGRAFYDSGERAVKLEFYQDGKLFINQVAPEYYEKTAQAAPSSQPADAAASQVIQ